ncbi:MAG: tRNA (N(6)-L-threonylcarbamoyladenosine(37)-C(2))-methylthiotransferase MtaB [Mycoplasmataceae bacterium]|jgi:threonylcarbamoyladenosine tRNA methylthiotransferase MtaB|nr:tRNA (N(6)-L-threonylcarbamoyladenosine(37)-C(2))-methylthiotransferase MtaB [Mycoplasmataceae bacterium]
MQIQSKKFSVITLGCKTNIVESNDIIAQLKSLSAVYVDDITEAEILVINTCCVTKKAEVKSNYFINKANKLKNVKHVIVIGCYSQLKQRLLKHDKFMIVLGTQYKSMLKSLINKYVNKTIYLFDNYEQTPLFEIVTNKINKTRAFYKIQDGCDNQCAYCIIPQVRGKSRSLDHNEVLMDIHNLANKQGFKEIVLTGINLGAYNDNGFSLFDLLEQINYMPGTFRIRLSSLEPNYLTKEIVDLITNNHSRWCQHLHISLQNCNNDILKSMYRKYTYEDFAKLCTYIKQKNNLFSITVDYIIGFPNETNELFTHELETLENSNISYINIFPFSLRPNTPAEKIENLVDEKTKTNRYKQLQKLNEKLLDKYLLQFIGQSVNVLFEMSKLKEYQQGHSEYFFNVYVKTKEHLTNTIRRINVQTIEENKVIGVL